MNRQDQYRGYVAGAGHRKYSHECRPCLQDGEFNRLKDAILVYKFLSRGSVALCSHNAFVHLYMIPSKFLVYATNECYSTRYIQIRRVAEYLPILSPLHITFHQRTQTLR
jgi:hypothetical protein